MQDASEMCVGHVWDVRETCMEHEQDASVQAQNLAIKLLQDVRDCHTPFARWGCIQTTCRMCPEHMRDTSEMRAGHIWDACENYFGAELYCSTLKALHFES